MSAAVFPSLFLIDGSTPRASSNSAISTARWAAHVGATASKVPALAVMPTSLIPNWLDEAARFTPQLKVLALHGANRQKDFASLAGYDLVLTTYALLPRDLEVLQQQVWSLLILDEALSGLDLSTRGQIANLLLDLQRRFSLTYLLVTHDVSMAAVFAHEVAVMDAGRIAPRVVLQERLNMSPDSALASGRC